ncbi:MAG TPA: SMC-Scp complex subunit ScpB [Thermoanaerobaculia bacterium]|jgi:segregation and condensation protein B|nr:SMC-Scp complex subunit ScpB [Thermoanaerobaculia bacterium]
MIERSEMEAALEAILFVSSEPVPRTKLLELFDEEDRAQAAEALEAVLARYGEGDGSGGRGVLVEDVAGGVRLATRPEVAGWLRRFFDVSGGTKLSMAALETLAIIAYRQPITGPEIQELRGVSAVGVLKTLLERRLVRITGRKEVVGKPFLYGTTKEFLVHFGLNSLKDLPPLEEFEETFGASGGTGAGGIGGGAEVSASTLEAFLPAEPSEEMMAALAADTAEGVQTEDREETFLREVAAIEESADTGEPE